MAGARWSPAAAPASASVSPTRSAAGADVVVTYRTHTPTAGLHGIQVDAIDEPAVADAVRQAVEHLGGLDVLVNNVGGLVRRATLAELDLATWRQVLAVNLDSTYLFTHHALPHLTRGTGRIINMASLAAHTGGHPGAIAYATAKAGVVGFTRALATELGPEGITVNAVAPGFIEATPFHDTFTTEESKQRTVAGIPLGRAGRPADVAGAVTWLASADAGYVSGDLININGAQYFH